MNRRNFLVNFLLWILAFFFGYTIKKESENLFETDAKMTLNQDGKRILDKAGNLNEQLATNEKEISLVKGITGLSLDAVPIIAPESDYRGVIERACLKVGEGGIISIPFGKEYLVNTTPKITTAKVKIVGYGTIKLGSNGIYALSVRADDVIIFGIKVVNPNGYNMNGGTKCGGIEVRANNVQIISCHLDGLLHPIMVEADGEWKGTQIIGNKITNCIGLGREDVADGICVFGSDYIISNNLITCKSGHDARIGINVEALPDFRSDGRSNDGRGIIEGNIVRGSFRRGIHVEISETTVQGNLTTGTTWWGIMVYGNRNTIGNNIVFMPKQAITVGTKWSPYIAGIRVMKGIGNIVKGNVIIGGGAGGRGIDLYSKTSDNIVSDNQFVGNSNSMDFAIYSISQRNKISGNKGIPGVVSKKGIYVYQGNRQRIFDNEFEKCGEDGIYLEQSPYSRIERNEMLNNVLGGIRLINSDNCKIINNDSYDNQSTKTQQFGIYSQRSENLTILNNDVDSNLSANISLQSGSTTESISGNKGFKNNIKGLATILTGQNSIVITHGLNVTPTNIVVTPRGKIGFTWITNITNTQFTINCSSTPTANVDVSWRAEN